ncbi:MAG: prepilin peptidase [Acidobacteria bacterium]|nr:prepilin peptidase [Acidobacteriota bacterium]
MSTTSSAITLAAVITTAGAATVIDIRTRRIPNALTVATAALGLALGASGASGVSVGSSVAGFALGMLLMLPGHLLGATGAGDVKLLAALGAIVGAGRIGSAFLYSAVAGGGLALLCAVQRRRFKTTLRRTGRLLAAARGAREDIESPAAANRFPYGPAIAAGSVLAVLLGG